MTEKEMGDALRAGLMRCGVSTETAVRALSEIEYPDDDALVFAALVTRVPSAKRFRRLAMMLLPSSRVHHVSTLPALTRIFRYLRGFAQPPQP